MNNASFRIVSDKKFRSKRAKLGVKIRYVELIVAGAVIKGFYSEYDKWIFLSNSDVRHALHTATLTASNAERDLLAIIDSFNGKHLR